MDSVLSPIDEKRPGDNDGPSLPARPSAVPTRSPLVPEASDFLEGDAPAASRWPGYEIADPHGSATYRIRVENPAGAGRGVQSVLGDGQSMPGGAVPLYDDGRENDVRVSLGDGTR